MRYLTIQVVINSSPPHIVSWASGESGYSTGIEDHVETFCFIVCDSDVNVYPIIYHNEEERGFDGLFLSAKDVYSNR